MTSGKIGNYVGPAVVCLLSFAAGCAQTSTLALKFAPQESATYYRVVTEREKSVEFEGPLAADKAFEGGHTSSKVDMTFTQEIQSLDDKGNAIAKITIKGLKYFSTVKDKREVDFDSSRKKDLKHPLAKLIGQSYTIKLSPAGEVVGIVNVREAQSAVRGKSPAHKTALALLKRNAIKERHTVPALPPAGKNKVRPGDKWSNIRSISYGGWLGSETYERIYTLREFKDVGGHRIGIIDMNSIPSAEMAEELYKKRSTGLFPKMADNSQRYTGRLELDLTVGKVEKCFEELRTEWIIVDPSIKTNDKKGPAAVRMGVHRLYSFERID